MPQRNKNILLGFGFAGMLAVELLFHWLLQSDASPALRRLYLSKSKLNSITMLVDNYIPAAILGFINGWVGYEWSTYRLNATAICLAGGVTLAQGLYSLFFPKHLLWWWPPQWGEGLFWFMTAIVFALFFTHFARGLRLYRKKGTA